MVTRDRDSGVPGRVRAVDVFTLFGGLNGQGGDCIIGFEQLAAELRKPTKSLHRMLGPRGNPNTVNFFAVLKVLQKTVSVKLTVKAA